GRTVGLNDSTRLAADEAGRRGGGESANSDRIANRHDGARANPEEVESRRGAALRNPVDVRSRSPGSSGFAAPRATASGGHADIFTGRPETGTAHRCTGRPLARRCGTPLGFTAIPHRGPLRFPAADA